MSFNSIRTQLLGALLFPLAFVALVQFWVAFHTAGEIAQSVTDRLLLASARSIAEHVTFSESGVEASVPPSALSLFDLGYSDRVFYRITTSDGRLLAGHADLDPTYRTEPTDRPRFHDAQYNDVEIRLVGITQPLPTPERTIEVLVVVAETLRGQNAMRTALWLENSRQQASLVVVALAVTWFALRRGLDPLLRLSDTVKARRPDEYRPFAAAALQTELRPLVAALNDYMLRLGHQVEAQRRFTANAAHQLRTPLTLLRMQASYALRSSEDERVEAIRAILTTTSQLARLTNQLLALARSERDRQTFNRTDIDLSLTMREVLEERGPLAIDRKLDLSFDIEPGALPIVNADADAIRDLMVNLVDNALRYTPPCGRVIVAVGSTGGACFIRVEDTGPGIPLAERERVFERFYRVREGETEGSGLGLAIVKEIVDAHAGSIVLSERIPGPGFIVEIRFDAAPSLQR